MTALALTCGFVILVLSGLIWRMWRAFESDRDTYLHALSLAISEGLKERERYREQISEMATRIQHPELSRPDIDRTQEIPAVPVYDDGEAWAGVGQVLPEEMNGDE